MNETVSIEIVSDVVCPWCYIGLRRLERALAIIREESPGFSCVKRWRPFFLNPDTPPEGEPYLPFLIQKFGGIDRVQAIFDRVRAAGAEYGLRYNFDKIQLRANTLQAHRLIHWAQQRGDAEKLVERLFVGQFQNGEHVGSAAVLAVIAEECGYDRTEVADYLASDDDEQLVRQMERESHGWGVTAVPTFIVERKVVVPGAEDPQVLAEAIRQVLRPDTSL